MSGPTVSLTPEQAGQQITRGNLSWGTVLGAAAGPITFAFRDTAPSYTVANRDVQGTFSHVTAAEITASTLALNLWSDVANIAFSRVGSGTSGPGAFSDNATILFGNYRSTTDGAAAFASYPSPTKMGDADQEGDVWVNTTGPGNINQQNLNPVVGAYSFLTFVHEIGHALGLQHPGDYNANPTGQLQPTYETDAVYKEDTRQYSLMSYFDASKTGANHSYNGTTYYAATPLLYDIMAIQRLYGANTTTRTGDTVYGFNSNADRSTYHLSNAASQAVFAIWDAGGNDTLDVSGYFTNQTINLAPGHFSSIGNLTQNVAVTARPANAPARLDYYIENANGGGGSDLLLGNAKDNRLTGGAGRDTLSGLDGNDTLDGGAGADLAAGRFGDDSYIVDNAQDVVKESTGEGNDRIFVSTSYVLRTGVAVEILSTDDDASTALIDLTGNELANTLIGNDGVNVLDGRDGADTMQGLGGNDLYYVDNAGDVVKEAVGANRDEVIAAVNYTLTAGSAVEILRAIASTDNFTLSGNNRSNTIIGNAGDDTLYGQGGLNWLEGKHGNDLLIGGDDLDTAVFSQSILQYCFTHNADGTLTIEHEFGSQLDGTDILSNVEYAEFAGQAYYLPTTDVRCGSDAGEYLLGKLGVDDYIHSGKGADSVIGDYDLGPSLEPGNDVLLGDAGNDILEGQYGGDRLYGGADDDMLYSIQHDAIPSPADYVKDESNLLDGGAGDDRLYSQDWRLADTIMGGSGIDLAWVDRSLAAVGATLSLANPAILQHLPGGTTLLGIERLIYYAGSGNDRIIGGAFADTVYGNTGADVLDGARGADYLNGGAGNDTYFVDNINDILVESDGYGHDRVLTAISFDLPYNGTFDTTSFEILAARNRAGTLALTLRGNDYDNTLIGNAGNNVFDGNPQLVIFGDQTGFDTMIGLAGDDTYIVHFAEDVVRERTGEGNDTILVSLTGGASGYTLGAGVAVETLQMQNAGAGNSYNLAGNELANQLIGNGGANVLDGKGGADTMRGLGYNDTYKIDNAGDKVFESEGGGSDSVITTVSYALQAGCEIEFLGTGDKTAAGAIDLTGNEFSQTLEGNAADNRLDGKTGGDKLYGLAGDDTFIVDDIFDRTIELAGEGNDQVKTSITYFLEPGQEIETLQTINANAVIAIDLYGNDFANRVIGNAGANIVNGRAGNDTLTGGAGTDSFSFDSALDGQNNVDTLTDFNVAADTIRLNKTIFTALATATGQFLAADEFSIGAAAHDASDRIIYNSTTGTIKYDADGTGATAAVFFVKLAADLALTPNDFFVT